MLADTQKGKRHKADSKGQKEHRKRHHLRTDMERLYREKRNPLRLDDQEFRFTLIRPELTNVDFSDRLESCEWRDEGNAYNLNTIPVLRGSVTWRQDDRDLGLDPINVRDGHQVRCDVKWLGNWEPLWQMRIIAPPSHTLEDGAATAEVADDLILATLSRGNFRYRKGKKKHKRGWRYTEIVADVAERYGIPLGKMVKGEAWIANLHQTATSPLEIIRQAVMKEQEKTGRRFIIVWRPQKDANAPGGWRFCLNVIHPTRNPLLYTMRDQIRSATSEPLRRSKFATSVVVTGSQKKKGGKRRKLRVRVNADGRGNRPKRGKKRLGDNLIKRYGFIERHLTMPGNDLSRQDLIDRAKHELAVQSVPTRRLSNFVHYGIAFVRRGDVVLVDLPEEGYSGKRAYMFVVSVTHSLSPDDYTMTLELTWKDPLDPEVTRKMREKALRAKKRAERGKRKKG
jgi:hypothetical protein